MTSCLPKVSWASLSFGSRNSKAAFSAAIFLVSNGSRVASSRRDICRSFRDSAIIFSTCSFPPLCLLAASKAKTASGKPISLASTVRRSPLAANILATKIRSDSGYSLKVRAVTRRRSKNSAKDKLPLCVFSVFQPSIIASIVLWVKTNFFKPGRLPEESIVPVSLAVFSLARSV